MSDFKIFYSTEENGEYKELTVDSALEKGKEIFIKVQNSAGTFIQKSVEIGETTLEVGQNGIRYIVDNISSFKINEELFNFTILDFFEEEEVQQAASSLKESFKETVKEGQDFISKELEDLRKKFPETFESLKELGGEIRVKGGQLVVEVKTITKTIRRYGEEITSKELPKGFEETLDSLKKLFRESSILLSSSKYERETDKRVIVFEAKENAFKQRLKKETEAALKNFDKVASMLLTEPYLYTDDWKEELNRIQSIFNENTLPIFYQSIETIVTGTNHFSLSLNDKERKTIEEIFLENRDFLIEEKASYERGLITGGTILGIVITYLSGGALLPVLIGMSVETSVGISMILNVSNSSESSKLNLERINKGLKNFSNKSYYTINEIKRAEKIFQSSSKEEKELFEKDSRLIKKESLDFGSADQIPNVADILSNRGFASYPCFKHFEDLIYKIGANSKLENLLKKKDIVKTNVANQINFYSEEIIGKGMYEYLYYLLAFPWENNSVLNEYDYSDLFFDTGRLIVERNDFENYSFYKEINKVDKKVLITQQIKAQGLSIFDDFFKPKREQLKKEQEQKINFLLAVREALVEQTITVNSDYFYSKPEYRKYVEALSNNSIFELMEESAYPDIDLPSIHLNFDRVKKLNPSFYYFNPDEKDLKIEKEIGERLIEKSTDFKTKVAKGIVAGAPVDFENFSTTNLRATVMNDSSPDYLQLDSRYNNGITAENGNIKVSTNAPNADAFIEGEIVELNAIKPPQIKVDLGAFKNEEELKAYTDSLKEQIESLKEESQKIKSLFGGKSFTEKETDVEEVEDDEVKKFLKQINTNLQIGRDINEYSSNSSLNELLEKSSESFSSTIGMQKAFPTFRLYLIEEDSIFSGALTAYDDFYSYASVISFSVHNSRELAAATATIELQNVSGILDGTKKEVLRDIDVDNNTIISSKDDKYEKLIESIVLRPGVNVQLRAGYENSTKDLEILLTGKVTDIQHGGDGMTTTIVVQSHAVELEQKIKGNLTRGNENNTFYSTHQLLGSLMLSPELKHFGRIKVGKVFQDHESKSLSLDVKDYSNQKGFTLNYTLGVWDYLAENAGYIAIGVSLIPPAFKFAGSFLSKAGFIRNIAAQINRGASLGSRFLSENVPSVVKLLSQGKLISFLGKVIRGGGDDTLIKASRGILKSGNISKGSIFIPGNTIPLSQVKTLIGKLTNGTALDAAETTILTTLRSNLGDDYLRALTALGGEVAIVNEGILFSYLLKAEGMVFTGVRNYSVGALAAARTAMIQMNTAAGSGFLNWLVSIPKYATKHTLTAAKIGASLSISTLLLDLASYAYQKTSNKISDIYKSIFGAEKDDSLKIMFSPQDDNIFAPDPNTYLRRGKDGGAWSALKFKAKRASLKYGDTIAWGAGSVYDFFADDNIFDDSSLIKKSYDSFKELFDTRLIIEENENEYIVQNQTIWNIFHEMSLRHPGYIYGARPYKDTIEYRMFFGLGNQNYWAKDLSQVDAIRLNLIFKNLVEDKKEYLPIDVCKILYPKITKEFLKLSERRMFYNSEKSVFLNGKEKTPLVQIQEKTIQKIVTKHAFEEYLEKTKDRFVPFRKMFSADSEKNVVANNITISSHNVINGVSVHYRNSYGDSSTDEGENLYTIDLAANTSIKQHNLKQKAIHNENIIGTGAAYRYGISELINGAKNLYTGSILILGDSKINPWDVVILNDDVNRMYGPLEVKSITHTFNHQTGFLTDVEINALVTSSDDMLTYPMISSSIIAQAKEELYKEYSSKAVFDTANVDDGAYKEIIERLVKKSFESVNLDKALEKEIVDFYLNNLKEEIKAAEARGEPVFLQDIISNELVLPEQLKSRIKAISETALAGTLVLGSAEVAVAKTLFRSPGLTNLRSPIGVGFLATAGVLSALAFGTDTVFKSIESSLRSGNLGKNLFRPIMFSKISNQNCIEVYPLVKDGKPLLAGGFENIPAEQSYMNVLGNIFSMASNGYEGYLKYENEINAGGKKSILSWDDADDFIEIKQGYLADFFEGNKSKIGKEIYHYARKAE